jgi:predicted 3-demethylubiquinone-9 3-methyltransferase (glyoxalase superfamily)
VLSSVGFLFLFLLQSVDMQKIIPHFWYDKEAREAAEFYTSLFPDSKITNITTLHDTPSGDCDIISFQVWGYSLMAISAGPIFKLNPSISLMVNFDPSQDPEAKTRIDEIYAKLMEGGKALMPLDAYPFSEHYAWVQDKHGLSWQLILTKPEGEVRPAIIPSIMFVGDVCGKAEEATDFYLSVFKDSPSAGSGQAKRGTIAKYPAGAKPDKEGTVMFTDFQLAGQWFAAMDSAQKHDFGFTEALSLIVNCENQDEIDYYWEKLSAAPESEQCGWLKDRYGLSWQIVPRQMHEMMEHSTPEQLDRVTQAFLPMKKLDLAVIQNAYEGK